MNIDERIEDITYSLEFEGSKEPVHTDIKQLIHDVLEEVKPERYKHGNYQHFLVVSHEVSLEMNQEQAKIQLFRHNRIVDKMEAKI